MKKMKIGIPVSVFMAAVYFGATQSMLFALVLLAYAMLAEREETRAGVNQAILVFGGIWLVQGILTVAGEVLALLNNFVGSGYLHMPYGLTSLVSLLADGLLLVFGVLALLGKDALISSKQVESAVASARSSAPASEEPKP